MWGEGQGLTQNGAGRDIFLGLGGSTPSPVPTHGPRLELTLPKPTPGFKPGVMFPLTMDDPFPGKTAQWVRTAVSLLFAPICALSLVMSLLLSPSRGTGTRWTHTSVLANVAGAEAQSPSKPCPLLCTSSCLFVVLCPDCH